MEDSGIDSDQIQCVDRKIHNAIQLEADTEDGEQCEVEHEAAMPLVNFRKPSYLQKRLERQRDLTRKSASSTIDFQPKKSLLARNRLSVPGKGTSTDRRPDEQPLVSWQSDSDEEEEFNLQQLSQETRWQIQQQLIKDGYNLDTLPDDEDLDLIPPRPLQDRCTSCCENATHLACSLQ